MGQQTGDGLHGVTHVLAAAEVAGQRPPVLQMGDAVTSSAITSADRPVILRSLMIAARDAFPTTRP
jgi:hypothetical protein